MRGVLPHPRGGRLDDRRMPRQVGERAAALDALQHGSADKRGPGSQGPGRHLRGRRQAARPPARKGRKERTLPLWDDVSELLRVHIEANALGPGDYLFASRNVEHLTRFGARHRIDAAFAKACAEHPELRSKSVSAHTFRHSCAMAMLAAGIDIATVAIWLGHEHINTTHRYVVSDIKLMEDALSKVRQQWSAIGRRPYKASDDVLEFLRGL